MRGGRGDLWDPPPACRCCTAGSRIAVTSDRHTRCASRGSVTRRSRVWRLARTHRVHHESGAGDGLVLVVAAGSPHPRDQGSRLRYPSSIYRGSSIYHWQYYNTRLTTPRGFARRSLSSIFTQRCAHCTATLYRTTTNATPPPLKRRLKQLIRAGLVIEHAFIINLCVH